MSFFFLFLCIVCFLFFFIFFRQGTEVDTVVFGVGIGHAGFQCFAFAAEQLADGNEGIAFFGQLIDGGNGAVNGSVVEIVKEDNGTVAGLIEDLFLHGVGISGFPVQGVDGPENQRCVHITPDGVVDAAVGGADDQGVDIGTDDFVDFIFGFLEAGVGGGAVGGSKVQVIPGMVADFVAFVVFPEEDIAEFIQPFAHDEKGGLNVPFFQLVQKFYRIFAGAVIEGQGHQSAFFLRSGTVGTAVGGGLGVGGGLVGLGLFRRNRQGEEGKDHDDGGEEGDTFMLHDLYPFSVWISDRSVR